MEELKRNQVISIQVIEMLEQLPCANEKDASSIDILITFCRTPKSVVHPIILPQLNLYSYIKSSD